MQINASVPAEAAEITWKCICGCLFPDPGIAREHIQWVHTESHEPGNLESLEDAIERMISGTGEYPAYEFN
jgi:hypothetical protein